MLGYVYTRQGLESMVGRGRGTELGVEGEEWERGTGMGMGDRDGSGRT